MIDPQFVRNIGRVEFLVLDFLELAENRKIREAAGSIPTERDARKSRPAKGDRTVTWKSGRPRQSPMPIFFRSLARLKDPGTGRDLFFATVKNSYDSGRSYKIWWFRSCGSAIKGRFSVLYGHFSIRF